MKKLKIVLTPSKPPLLARLTKEPGNWIFLGHHGWRWVPDRQKAKVLTRGIRARPRPKFKHDYQIKNRVGKWLAHPRPTIPSLFGNKRFVLGMIILVSIIGANIMLGNIYAPPNYSHKIFQMGPDPTVIVGTRVFHILLPGGTLSEFNTFVPNSGTVGVVGCAGQFEANSKCIQMQSNSTFTALALTKNPFSISSAAQNNLAISEGWANSGLGPGFTSSTGEFGFYLTTNATLPTTANYNPKTDKSVFMVSTIFCSSGCTTNTPTMGAETRFLRNVGDTISGEEAGCGPNVGSVFFCNTQTYSIASVDINYMTLNYTGFTNTPSGSNCVTSPATTGSGCSFQQNANVAAGNGLISTTVLPPLKIQAHEFYWGFYITPTGPAILWGTDNNNDDLCCGIKTVNLAQILNGQTTAGFFQPLVDAVVASGVFILKTLIIFFTFVVNVVKNALDAIGGLVGLGAIGTALFTILAAAGNFISSVVTTIGSQLANIVGFITSAASAIVAFLNSGASFIWTQVTNFFNLWAVLFPLFNTIFLVFTAFSQNGVQLAQYALIFWWLYGIFVVLEQGTEKWWNHWVGMGEEAFKKVFNLGYWMVELSFHWLVWLKNLLAQWV